MLAGLSGVTMTVHFLRCTSERYIADEINALSQLTRVTFA
jgi:hypothetical protein